MERILIHIDNQLKLKFSENKTENYQEIKVEHQDKVEAQKQEYQNKEDQSTEENHCSSNDLKNSDNSQNFNCFEAKN